MPHKTHGGPDAGDSRDRKGHVSVFSSFRREDTTGDKQRKDVASEHGALKILCRKEQDGQGGAGNIFFFLRQLDRCTNGPNRYQDMQGTSGTVPQYPCLDSM